MSVASFDSWRDPRHTLRGCVLLLPGGKTRSDRPFRSWHLANQRMALLASALRPRLGDGVDLQLAHYRVRGWNGARRDPLREASLALDEARTRFEPAQIVLLGHSMGGRVAAHLSARGDAGAVVALAPWWPDGDGDLIPLECRLLVVHGSADTWTDPVASRVETGRAAQRGVDATWVGVDGAGHYMIKQLSRWNQLTADFIAAHLESAAA